MPVQSVGHRLFWRARANPLPPPAGPQGGYPAWQSSVVAGSLFGGLQTWWMRLSWWIAWGRRLWRLTAGQRVALERAYDVLLVPGPEGAGARGPVAYVVVPVASDVLARVQGALRSPAWPAAQEAVRVVAQSPSFHRPEMWTQYGRLVKANAGRAQNIFRRVKAEEELTARVAEPLTNPEKALLVELAYQDFAIKGR